MTRWDELQTERLLMRHWRKSDREPFAAMNADPVVMRHFPSTLDGTRSEEFLDRKQGQLETHGWGLWAVELVASGEFIGFVGLAPVAQGELPPGPCTEVGWRLAAPHWGHGYAPEAGRAALDVAFDGLGLPEVVSFTTEGRAAKPPLRRAQPGRVRGAEHEAPLESGTSARRSGG